MKYNQPYIPPTLTVDAVIFQLINYQLHVLLIERANEPFKGFLALPGGYSPQGETTFEALTRVVKTKAGVDLKKDLSYIEQLYTFDTVARDPRGHAVSVSYLGAGSNILPKTTDSNQAKFYHVSELPKLAYDHQEVIKYAHERLRSKLSYTNAVYAFLPKKFTLTELQKAYEAILGQNLDKRNFRKKFLSFNLINETDEFKREGAHRPAKLYQFNSKKLESLSKSFE